MRGCIHLPRPPRKSGFRRKPTRIFFQEGTISRFGWLWGYQLTQVVLMISAIRTFETFCWGVVGDCLKKYPALGFSKDSKYANICGSTAEFNSFAVRFNSKDIYSLLALQHLLSKHHGQKRSSQPIFKISFSLFVSVSQYSSWHPPTKICFDWIVLTNN